MNHLSIPSGLQIGGGNTVSLHILPNNTMYNDTLYTNLLTIQRNNKKRCTKKNKQSTCNKLTKKNKHI
jgi:hypothetical protein